MLWQTKQFPFSMIKSKLQITFFFLIKELDKDEDEDENKVEDVEVTRDREMEICDGSNNTKVIPSAPT